MSRNNFLFHHLKPCPGQFLLVKNISYSRPNKRVLVDIETMSQHSHKIGCVEDFNFLQPAALFHTVDDYNCLD